MGISESYSQHISLASCTYSAGHRSLSRTYLRIDYVGIQAVYTPPYPTFNSCGVAGHD